MCKSKMSADAAEPISTPRSSRSSRTTRKSSLQKSSSSTDPSTSNIASGNFTGSSYNRDSSRTSISSRTSLSSLKDSLPESPHIYDISEICSATNNFNAKRLSSPSSASWRCIIRGRDVVVFQRKFRRSIEPSKLQERLALICRSHHVSIIKLLGASIAGGNIYLVYEYVNGANLRDCLRNPKNPNFTVLSTWISRMQIATDLAHGLDYIHNFTGLDLSPVHNHIESSTVIVTERSFNARICHFGTAELCGEVTADHRKQRLGEITEITEEASSSSSSSSLFKSQTLKRMGSGTMKFEGTRGYMPPEFQSNGIATQKTDVYAFGIVILELLSGEEPLKYRFDKATGEYLRISVVQRAKEAIDGGGGNGDEEEERRGRLRRWVDGRLKDSYPVDVAEKMTRIALECVDVDPDKRPDMGRVAGNISKLYLESMNWSNNMQIPTDFTVSFAPR